MTWTRTVTRNQSNIFFRFLLTTGTMISFLFIFVPWLLFLLLFKFYAWLFVSFLIFRVFSLLFPIFSIFFGFRLSLSLSPLLFLALFLLLFLPLLLNLFLILFFSFTGWILVRFIRHFWYFLYLWIGKFWSFKAQINGMLLHMIISAQWMIIFVLFVSLLNDIMFSLLSHSRSQILSAIFQNFFYIPFFLGIIGILALVSTIYSLICVSLTVFQEGQFIIFCLIVFEIVWIKNLTLVLWTFYHI